MAGICCDSRRTFAIVNVSSAIFEASAPDLASCPDESLPEFAFIGRSNVGKSSLLNLLAGERDLARVSRMPGFTKLINVFIVDGRWRLVDLPGYGYAQVARVDSAKFNLAVLDYLQHRKNLRCIFALIDGSLPPQDIDVEFVEWLARNSLPFVLVFTKSDKVKADGLKANIQAFRERIAAWFVTLPAVYKCSAMAGRGRRELLEAVGEILGNEPEAPVPSKGPAAVPARKPRPAPRRKSNSRKPPRDPGKIARPW